MAGAARVFRILGFAVTTLFGLVATLFVAGYALTDPGGPEGALVVAAWVVPMVVLIVLALRRPGAAKVVLDVLVLLVLAAWIWYAFDNEFWRALINERGPILAIATFAIATPAGVLGLRRPADAAQQLLVLGLAPIVVLIVLATVLGEGLPENGLRTLLGTSGGIGTVPTTLAAVLFFIAAGLARSGLPDPSLTWSASHPPRTGRFAANHPCRGRPAAVRSR
jgi:hypothetical protein